MSDSEDDGPAAKTAFSSADPPRNFSLSVGERIRALTIGAPAYATRKKGIEDTEERYVRALVALHDTLIARGELDGVAIARALHEKASAFDLRRINAQIEIHNRYYPVEANLAMDLRTGGYLVYGRRWLPEEPCTAALLVHRALQRLGDDR